MTPALKLNVMFANFPYGGNGATSSEHPHIRQWTVETVLKMHVDPRIGWFDSKDFSDTPITLTRNEAVCVAKEKGAHLLLMIDSDQSPNLHASEKWFKPFWDEAFNFIYDRYQKGPHVVFAPYCGPPNGTENVYVFKVQTLGNHAQQTSWKLEPYGRDEASMMTGIQEAAAGPTGMILFDMRAFDLIEPVAMSKRDILENVQTGVMTVEEAEYAMRDGYFYYEYENQRCSKKASTEDVTATRDIALAGMAKLGYNPLYCAWDSWVGHHKPWNVGKPQRYMIEQVNASYRKAVLDGARANERIIDTSQLNQGNDQFSRRMREMVASSEARASQLAPSNGHKSNGHFDYKDRPWHEHGHMPQEHLEALAAEVNELRGSTGRRKPVGMEVGTWLGSSAIAMTDACPDLVLYCVDTWAGSPSDETSLCVQDAGGPDAVYKVFLARIGDRLHKNIFPCRGPSLEAAGKLWSPFDLIFLDADHSYESVKADILAWWKHLRDDGVMLGHDYMVSAFPGVKKAVHELFGDKMEPFGMSSHGGFWKVRKADFPNGLEAEHDTATAR